MFYYLNGTLALLEGGIAVVDCGGVGYMCNVGARTEAALGQSIGKNVKLFTYLSVREDAMELFGFPDRQELSMFKLLISVSGVGARTALAIQGAVTPDKLAFAVSTGDVKSIKAPGVGPKIAARIILELKDKVGGDFSGDAESIGLSDVSKGASGKEQSNKLSDARTALMELGFSKTEAEGLMRKVDCSKLSVEEIIREALKRL